MPPARRPGLRPPASPYVQHHTPRQVTTRQSARAKPQADRKLTAPAHRRRDGRHRRLLQRQERAQGRDRQRHQDQRREVHDHRGLRRLAEGKEGALTFTVLHPKSLVFRLHRQCAHTHIYTHTHASTDTDTRALGQGRRRCLQDNPGTADRTPLGRRTDPQRFQQRRRAGRIPEEGWLLSLRVAEDLFIL